MKSVITVLLLAVLTFVAPSTTVQRIKKIVFIAGTKSHGPGDHEYEKAMRLLSSCINSSPNLKGYRTEVHLYGWPENPNTLEDADSIVLYSDGSDQNELAHPLLVGNRLEQIRKQMKRGCGLVLLHYATFTPVNRGGQDYLNWVGGFFDYETGTAPNHWASAIQYCDAKPFPASPSHPISEGITPFNLREEYYYKMRFVPEDSRRTPILNVKIPGETEPQTVAWAVQRKDGGRGFAFTGGHPFTNFLNGDFRRVVLNAIVWSAHGDVPKGGVRSEASANIGDINVLILTGKHHPAHDWQATTAAMKDAFAKDTRIKTTVFENPANLATADLSTYDLIVQNYCNWESPTLSSLSRKKLLEFVRGGKGLMLIHFANGAWRDWPEYHGKLARRVWEDGKANHDALGQFTAHIVRPQNRLVSGLRDFTISDELYCSQVGDLPVDPIVTAHSKVTDRDEPLVFTYSEGKGRVFQSLLGHGAESIRTSSYSELLRRAVAWTANREILPLPIEAPNANVETQKTSLTRTEELWPKINPRTSLDWTSVGNDKGGMRYSTLKQIDRTNVSNMNVAWTYHTKDHDPNGNSTIECTPIVVDGVMYLTTVRMNVVALNAATGAELWRFDPHAWGVNRGVAYWSDGKLNGKRRIIVAFSNGNMYSLDAHTGEVDPGFGKVGIVDLRSGIERDISGFSYGSSSAPMIFENLIIVGFLSSETGPGAPGDIRAFDVRTGKEVWRFHTVPRVGELGFETWPVDAWQNRGGANAWSGFTLDEINGIVFCGTGSAASDFYGADRLGDNLFANCTLALDARTGKRIWHFQTVHHDLWDRDNPCPPVVCTIKLNGKKVDVVAQPTKTGFLFVFDRKTGKPLFKVNEVTVPISDIPGEKASPTQPEPVKPPPFTQRRFTNDDVTNISPEANAAVLEMLRKLRHGSPYEPPSIQGSVIVPGFHGGATWSGASFDPTSGLLYVNSNNTPWVATLANDETLGYNFTGYNYFKDQNGYPAIKPPWGLLTAIDVAKGEFAWQKVLGEFPELTAKGVPLTGTENFGGTIVTAGGIVFIAATKDEKLHAFDATTGAPLAQYKLPAGGYATPCTYSVNGVQYIVIACGGGGKLVTKPGDSFVAFALPKVTVK